MSEGRAYRKKPVVIQAVQWLGRNYEEMDEFLGGQFGYQERFDGSDKADVVIATMEGTMRGEPGDWIIKGVKGEFYPCKPDIFEATYEPAERESR